jgi:hypothetical protein
MNKFAHALNTSDLFGILIGALITLVEVHGFSQSHANASIMPQIMSQLILATAFPINYSLVLVPFNSA